MSIAIIFAAVLQSIFFFTLANTVGTLLVIIAWVITNYFVIRFQNLYNYTFSTIIILGYCITQFCLPVIFTLLEGKPLIYNLDYPISVFIHATLALLVIITAFIFYKNHMSFIRSSLEKMLQKLNLFTLPSNSELWIIGIIGVLGIVIQRVIFGGYGEDRPEGEIFRILHGIRFYAYLPLLLLFPAILNREKHSRQSLFFKLSILFYIFFLIALGIMANSRGLFMVGVVTMGLIYFLGLLLGKFNSKVWNVKTFFIGMFGFWMLTGPLSDLGTAMVVVRGQRSDIPPKMLLQETLNTFNNKEELERYKDIMASRSTQWDEKYFNNIFLARFCNLKFSDASLQQAFHMRNPDEQMQEIALNKYISVFPQPVLDVAAVSLDKKFYTGASFGDFLYMRNSGVGYGGFRLGNFLGMGMASFGWWYLAILFFGAILLFNFVDALVQHKEGEFPKFTVVGLLSIFIFFSFFGIGSYSESVTNIFHYITRDWIQMIVLYCVLIWIARRMRGLIGV